jgi:hypothetical protein
MMNGFNDHGLDEDAFGASKGGIVSSFDAFREYTPFICESASGFGCDDKCLVLSSVTATITARATNTLVTTCGGTPTNK